MTCVTLPVFVDIAAAVATPAGIEEDKDQVIASDGERLSGLLTLRGTLCRVKAGEGEASGSRRTRHRGGAARTDEAPWRASWLDEYLRAGKRAQPPTHAAAGIALRTWELALVWG